MNITGKKLMALLLAACMLLGLAACGGDNDGDSGGQQLSETVFVPTYMQLDLEIDYVERVCVSGSFIYLMGRTDKEIEHTETDPDTGEETVWYEYESQYALYRVSTDGGAAVKLEAYQPIEPEKENEDDEVSAYIQDLRAGAEGTLWVTETVDRWTYNLPEDFDPDTDNKWDYQEYTSYIVYRQLDAEGNELSRSEGTGDQSSLAGQLGVEWLSGVYQDSKGNTYAVADTFIAVLDGEGTELFRVEGENLWNSMYELSDGSMAMLFSIWDEETGENSSFIRVVDLEAQDWGAEYPLPSNVYSIYPGGGDYLYYYRNGDSIYGYKAGAEAAERLFSWLDADINMSDVLGFGFLPDGRVAAVTRTWTDDGSKTELVLMTETPRSELPEKTTLLFGTMDLDYDMRGRIIDFNKTSTTHRIEVRNYQELAGGYEEGLTLLNTEMIAGMVPDILEVENMPVKQYGSRGLLEDLWPFIDNDPELGRDNLVEAPLNAVSMDGKLYYIFPNYSIMTVIGDARVVGDRMSWTLADMNEALEKMPEGCTIFGQYDTKEGMLSNILAQNMDGFVDWTTGECTFDTDEFKALLEFCNSFPAEIQWDNEDYVYESDYARMMNGKQMLTTTVISDLDYSFRRYSAVLDGNYAFVGYPMEDGSVGSSFNIYGGLAISAACKDKDAAWSFIRTDLLRQSEEDEFYYYGYGLPVNKADFDLMVEAATRQYQIDWETGETLLDEEGNPIPVYNDTIWIDENTEVEMKPVTQEDINRVMELINSIGKIYNYDERIYDIIREEAGGYFAGDVPLDSAATRIQSKVRLYVNEQR